MKIIEGSTLEGGGQILRNTVALSTLLGQPITVNNIRRGRTPSGMRAQHAAGINLVGQISQDSFLNGASKDSETLEYIPGKLTGGDYLADPGTAGSTTLLLQIAFPCLLYAPAPSEDGSKLRLRGGTNAVHAPQIDYIQKVFLPFMRQHFRVNADVEIIRRGYYPKGGGEVVVRIQPVSEPLPAIAVLDRGEVMKIRGRSYVAGWPIELAKDCRDAAVSLLTQRGIDPSIIDIPYVKELPTEAHGSGSGIVLWAETENGCILGGGAIGKKGADPAEVGKEAAEELFENLNQGGCVDKALQDQWIIFGALAKGTSRIRCGLPLTLQTRTAIWLAEQMTEAKFREIPDEDGKTVVLECDGIGFKLDDQ
ncbi:RNA 3'-terminal phosphate cyclase [Serendipita vermifera]|nr:RNA 3'-terminal phosphate cyclase [Serendipita vermifera]